MRNIIILLVCCFYLTIDNKIAAQQYSFTTFAFRIYDIDSVVLSLKGVNGFNHYYGSKINYDSISKFEINAVIINDDVNYQHVAKHTPGVWILYTENFKKWRPLRLFCIKKYNSNAKTQEMYILLNYNYHSCEMPCVFGKSEFKISDIIFMEGTYMVLERTTLKDWENQGNKVIRIEDEILKFISKKKIVLWDIEMIK